MSHRPRRPLAVEELPEHFRDDALSREVPAIRLVYLLAYCGGCRCHEHSSSFSASLEAPPDQLPAAQHVRVPSQKIAKNGRRHE